MALKKRFTVTLNDVIAKEAKKKAIDEDLKFSTLIEKLLVEYANGKVAVKK